MTTTRTLPIRLLQIPDREGAGEVAWLLIKHKLDAVDLNDHYGLLRALTKESYGDHAKRRGPILRAALQMEVAGHHDEALGLRMLTVRCCDADEIDLFYDALERRALAYVDEHRAFEPEKTAAIVQALEVWESAALGEWPQDGSYLFEKIWEITQPQDLEESEIDFDLKLEDPKLATKLPLPLDLLLLDRWDDAIEIAWQRTNHLATDDDRQVLDSLFNQHGYPGRDEWASAIDVVLQTLDANKQVEAATAWRMLRVDPNDRSSVLAVLTQMQWYADQGKYPEATLTDIQHRLFYWRQIANGKWHGSDLSAFRIAGVEGPRQSEERAAAGGAPTAFWSNMEHEKDEEGKLDQTTKLLPLKQPARLPPGIVVIPKAGATTLKRDQHGEYKDLVGIHLPFVVAPDLAEVRAALLREYPHADREIGVLLRDLREGTAAVMKPMLLVGEPGGGKSRVVRRLGEALGLFVYRYDASAAMDNMYGGVSKSWSSSVPSVPTRAVGMSKSPTAIVMVDEIEKAGRSAHNGNLWNAMGPFLERETSSRYRDVGLDCEVNLSHV